MSCTCRIPKFLLTTLLCLNALQIGAFFLEEKNASNYIILSLSIVSLLLFVAGLIIRPFWKPNRQFVPLLFLNVLRGMFFITILSLCILSKQVWHIIISSLALILWFVTLVYFLNISKMATIKTLLSTYLMGWDITSEYNII